MFFCTEDGGTYPTLVRLGVQKQTKTNDLQNPRSSLIWQIKRTWKHKSWKMELSKIPKPGQLSSKWLWAPDKTASDFRSKGPEFWCFVDETIGILEFLTWFFWCFVAQLICPSSKFFEIGPGFFVEKDPVICFLSGCWNVLVVSKCCRFFFGIDGWYLETQDKQQLEKNTKNKPGIVAHNLFPASL